MDHRPAPLRRTGAPLPSRAAAALGAAVLDLVLPARCIICDRVAPGMCLPCATTLPAAPELAPPEGVDVCRALMAHTGTGRRPAVVLKRHAPSHALDLLGGALAGLVPDRTPDLVTWAPTTARRRRRRGHDQAQLLAERVGAVLGLPVRGLLVRTDRTSQHGRSAAARRRGPRTTAVDLAPPHVLVVDDVRTTGATLRAAAAALREAGATTVDAVTVSARP